jgi:diacylglycerol kinase family enzyme
LAVRRGQRPDQKRTEPAHRGTSLASWPIEETFLHAPDFWRRLVACTAMCLAVLVVVGVVVIVAVDPWYVLRMIPLVFVGFLGAWYALTRVEGRRVVGLIVSLSALVAIVGLALFDGLGVTLLVVLTVGLLALSVGLARYALGYDVATLRGRDTAGKSVPAATQGVLIMNLRSGGGKAERFGLEAECRERGIEPVVLRPGDDLARLAHDAIDRGADVIGMAGGDGSQALVASVAVEREVPMVVVPAGTRNHLALDLGLDRDDVLGALDAYGEAVERAMDVGEVNGRAFVNNVSLGLYATIVRSPDYRDAKVDTTLATIPAVLGPSTKPFDLHFVDGHGGRHDGAHLIQVSNNPYGARGGSRPRLNTGQLGVIALEIQNDRAAAAFAAALAIGRPVRFAGLLTWVTDAFEVNSGGAIPAGVDGESLDLDPPLRFSIRPRPLRVRLPRHAIGVSPAARAFRWRSAARAVWDTALGRPVTALLPLIARGSLW